MFNILSKAIRMLSSCSVVGFKSQLDSYPRNIVDLPFQPGYTNSLDGGDCLHSGHLDVAKQTKLSKSKPKKRSHILIYRATYKQCNHIYWS